MKIKIFNTLTRKKEIFKPINEQCVNMYVCGPTVYSEPHIGNARAALIPDILFRLLKSQYNEVNYIRNITDVDDKIIDSAIKRKKTVSDVSDEYTKIYQQNMQALGLLNPTYEPRVTENISSIIEVIQNIINSGYTYIAEDHVLFNTEKFSDYGKLSNRTLDEMIDGVRIEVASYKKSPRDFVLWKPSINNQPGWDSPWGYGRPGWHIECTSMIKKIIGMDTTLDIHGGGNDLIFPHHENEIAQGFCMKQVKYCNYWFHNGIVLVNKKKMSKSLGNVILINEILKKESPLTIRLALMSAHYRQPLNWTDNTVNDSSNLAKKFLNIYEHSDPIDDDENDNELLSILADDLNTPQAITYLSSLSKKAKLNPTDKRNFILSCNFLGLNFEKTKSITEIDEDLIIKLIDERNLARRNKDFGKADKIRKKLNQMNIEIEDLKDKTVWKIK